jgi:hypothetical protein
MDLCETIEAEFGSDLRSSKEFCVEMWSALANIQWYYKDDKEDQGFTLREAVGVIAEIRDDGSYIDYQIYLWRSYDWYCSGPYAVVSEKIAERMAKHGWTWKDYV